MRIAPAHFGWLTNAVSRRGDWPAVTVRGRQDDDSPPHSSASTLSCLPSSSCKSEQTDSDQQPYITIILLIFLARPCAFSTKAAPSPSCPRILAKIWYGDLDAAAHLSSMLMRRQSGSDNFGDDDKSDGSWKDASDEGLEIDLEEIGLQEVIEHLRQQLRTVSEGHQTRAELLTGLGHVLFDQYSQTREMADLDESIQISRQVVDAALDPPVRSESLDALGIRLGERYSVTGVTADFEEAERAMNQAASLSGNPEPGSSWHNLGRLFGERYKRTQAPADLEEAIRISKLAVDTTLEQHPNWVACVDQLGTHLENRYSLKNDERDLEAATRFAKRALGAAPDNYPGYPGLLTNLGLRLGQEYLRTGTTTNLEEAIRYLTQAAAITPDGHPCRAMVLGNLGWHVGLRYSTNDTEADLEESIRLLGAAVSTTPDDDHEKPGYLNNLGLQLSERYLRTGAAADLDAAIQYLREAVDATLEDHPEMVTYHSNLGALLGDRHSRTGALADLEEAIRLLRQAVEATPQSHLHFPQLLTNLGIHLSGKCSMTKNEGDLEQAIRLMRQALACTPEGHPARITQFDILAISLGRKYSNTKQIADLEEAILFARKAVGAAAPGHPYQAKLWNNLGDELGNLYLRTKRMADLEEAIAYLQQAVDAMPAGHPDRSALLTNLGDQLILRHRKTRTPKDLQDALDHHQAALRQQNSHTISRILAGKSILGVTSDWQQAYEAASIAVGLVPRLSSRSLRNSDRIHALSQVVGLASDAAAVALQAGKTPLAALCLLEQGRGVLGASLEELRADMRSLRDMDLELAEQFVRVREELETSAPLKPQLEGGKALDASSRAWARRRYEASKEFDGLLAKIQGLPEFDDFLRPPSEADMRAAARCGPVIVVNVSQFRCDALLVETHQVRALHLSDLSKEDIQDKAWEGNLGSHEVLEWLWDKVTQPILDALGFTQPPSSDDALPHVWWIPTGPLSKFPLHAAGLHRARSAETVLDRAMSSYASSIRALVHDRRRPLRPPLPTTTGDDEALLVAIEHTPGAKDALPFATREVAVVRGICESMALRPVSTAGRKQDVSPRLRACRVFHFAGHGATDTSDAANSRLLLADGVLRVAELLEMNLAPGAPFLAYLSACGTGRVRAETSVDESVHLMSAFQLAGFRHVVGTLWEVLDEVCIDVARITYEAIHAGGATDSSVCRGLHDASRWLRNRDVDAILARKDEPEPQPEWAETGATRDVRPYDAGGGLTAVWAPYVHYGV